MNHFLYIKNQVLLLFFTWSSNKQVYHCFCKFLLKMNRLFGSSKSNAVPKPTLNDTAASLDSRVETINKQIAAVDQGLIN